MRLFASERIENLLPYDGLVTYYGVVLDHAEANRYFHQLLDTIDWRPDELVIAGRRIVTKREIAWYGDSSFSYVYSGTAKQALEWTRDLLKLRELVQNMTGARFNSCLLNLYHDGNEGLSWHSDNEDTLVKNGTIAALSLGAERSLFSDTGKPNKVFPFFLNTGACWQ